MFKSKIKAGIMNTISSTDLFNQLPDPTIILNNEGVVTAMNQAAVRLLETPTEQVIGCYIGAFLPNINHLLASAPSSAQYTLAGKTTSNQNQQLELVVSDLQNNLHEKVGLICVLHEQGSRQAARRETDPQAAILDAIQVMAVIVDGEGKITRANRAFCSIVEPWAGPILGARLWDLLEFNPGVAPVTTLSQFLSHSGEETRLAAGDGSWRIVTWSSQPYRLEHDARDYFMATGVDISTQKEMEHLLERERTLLRSLINSIPDLIFYKDVEGRYLGCNLAFEQFSSRGVQREIVGHTDFDLYPPGVAEQFFQSDQHVLQTQKILIYENQINRPEGQRIVLETRKSPYYGPDQNVLGVIGIGRDITQHKMDQEALRQANAEMAQLITSLSSILILISSDMTILHWNPSAQRNLGIAAEDAVKKPLFSLPIGWEQDRIDSGIQKCRAEGAAQYLDPMHFKRSAGGEGWLGVSISPVFRQDHAISGFILLCSDITERKELESQLAQGEKLKSIGQLAAGIAHEINTPIQYVGDNAHFLQTSFSDLLAVFKLYTDFLSALKRGSLAPGQIEQIEAAVSKLDIEFLFTEIPLAIEQSLDGIQRVSEIVRSMKEFSYPGMTHKTAVDINKGILNTITVARNEWKYVAEVELDLARDLPNVHCLPGEINQVLLNIIINAVHAIAETIPENSNTKGTILITSRRDGDWVEVRITDSGPGIPEHIQPHIFDPFFTTKEVGKGTGQGLAIAYNVIEVKHKGKLTFETRLGEGTTFIIRLPIQNVE